MTSARLRLIGSEQWRNSARHLDRRLINRMLSSSGQSRHLFWSLYYLLTNYTINDDSLQFLNLGIAGPEASGDFVSRLNAAGAAMYREVMRGVDVPGRDVIELACGRGGGARVLLTELGARHVTGIERTRATTERAQKVLEDQPGAEIRHYRRLEDVNLQPETFDIGLCVEAVHCMPHPRPAFTLLRSQVKPDGMIAVADLIHPAMSGSNELRYQFEMREAGLTIEDMRSLSELVCADREAISADGSAEEWLDRVVPRPFHREAREALFLPGTINYTDLERGAIRYVSWLLRPTRRTTPKRFRAAQAARPDAGGPSLLSRLEVESERAAELALAQIQARFADEQEDWRPLSRMLCAGGKGLRPQLVALPILGRRLNVDDALAERLATGAAAVEILHVGSLYHDDVIDLADSRRGIPTVNAESGNTMAVLCGDILFAVGSELAASLGRSEYRTFSETLRLLCVGQIRESQELRNPRRSQQQYFDAISGKTAALMACSTVIGSSIAAEPDPRVDQWRRFGHDLGMAFQIQDDILDIVGQPADLGKESGQDLRAGVVTLPVVIACEREPELFALVERAFDGADPGPVVERVHASGALDAALDVARDYGDAALRNLTALLGSADDARQVVTRVLPLVHQDPRPT